jgi:hypothetical protein
LYPFNTFRVPSEHLDHSPEPKEEEDNPELKKKKSSEKPKNSEEESSSAASLRKVDYLDQVERTGEAVA